MKFKLCGGAGNYDKGEVCVVAAARAIWHEPETLSGVGLDYCGCIGEPIRKLSIFINDLLFSDIDRRTEVLTPYIKKILQTNRNIEEQTKVLKESCADVLNKYGRTSKNTIYHAEIKDIVDGTKPEDPFIFVSFLMATCKIETAITEALTTLDKMIEVSHGKVNA